MSQGSQNDETTSSDLELVPLAEDIFIFTGDITLISDAELVEMPVIKSDSLERLRTEITSQIGVGNVGIQALDGMNKARGLVRLAPETMSAMKTGQLTRTGVDGWNIGVLADKSGQISSTVKWLPVSKASIALSSIASASSALTMLLMQMQLASIEKISLKTLETVQKLHLILNEIEWDQIHSNLNFNQQKAGQIIQLGHLSEHIFLEVIGQGTASVMPGKLNTQTKRMQRLSNEFKGKISLQARHEWLKENISYIMCSAKAALEAYDSLKIYQQILILNELQKEPSSTENSIPGRTAEIYFEQLESMESDFRNSVVPIIDEFLRASQLLIHAQGRGKKYKINPKSKKREFVTAQEIENIALQIYTYLRRLYPSVGRDQEIQSPDVKFWLQDESSYTENLELYSLLFPADEQILGVADVAFSSEFDKRILVTEKRILIVHQSQFSKIGCPMKDIDIARLGYSQYLSKVNSKGIQKFTMCLRNDFEKLDFVIKPSSQSEKIDFPDWLNSFASPSVYDAKAAKKITSI